MPFIGACGSREEPLRQLAECFASDNPEFRVVRGAFKVGKSSIIQKAVDAFRESGRKIEFWPSLAYNQLNLRELLWLIGGSMVVPPTPRSRIQAKRLERELELLRLTIATNRSINGTERLIISFAFISMGSAGDYIATDLLAGRVGTGNCICKFVLEQRRPSNAISWPIHGHERPEVNRVIEIEAFSAQEAYQFVDERLSPLLTPKIGNDQWQANKSVLCNAIVGFSGRHPAVLEATCGWVHLGIRRSGFAWQNEWCANAESAKTRIRNEVINHYLREASDIVTEILATLANNVQLFWTQLIRNPATRMRSANGELGTLVFVGLSDAKGAVPEIFSLLESIHNNQKKEIPIIDTDDTESVKNRLTNHYAKVTNAGDIKSVPVQTRFELAKRKLSDNDIETSRLSTALSILSRSDSDHHYEKNLQDALSAILD